MCINIRKHLTSNIFKIASLLELKRVCFIFMSFAYILYFKTPLMYQFFIKEKRSREGGK